MNSRATQQFNASPYIMQFTGCDQGFSIPIGQKVQLTGWDNGNEMHSATCVESKNFYRVALLSIPYTVLRT